MKKPALPRQHPIPKLHREIGGEVYDTETASVLYHHRRGDEGAPFAFGSVLMITVSDRYFVVDYNESGETDSAWLRPVTIPEGIAWAEQHCNGLVEDIFGRLPAPGEGPPYVPLPGPYPA